MSIVEQAADDFWDRVIAGETLPVEYADRLTLEEGYAIQLEIAERHAGRGNRRTGWAVKATNPAVQKQLGVSEPAFGSLREKTTFKSGYALPASTYVKPHVECEICFEVGEGIDEAETVEEILATIERCYPAFELIEKRCPVLDFGVALADNAEHTSFVIGDPVAVEGIKFDEVVCREIINGKEVASGTGAAVLGHPINSIIWLKEALARYGRKLQPGDLVITGSLVPQFPLNPGDAVTAEFSHVGSVSITVTD